GHYRRENAPYGEVVSLRSGVCGHAASGESDWPAARESISAWEVLGGTSAATRPARKTSTRSEMRSASARSVLRSTTALPLSARSDMIRCISYLAPTSSPWVGSANTSRSVRITSWRASTTFWALPPDIALTGWWALVVFTDRRRIRSSAIRVSTRGLTQPARRESKCKEPTVMLNAMDWKENEP